MKEGELSEEQQKASVSEFSLVKGLIIAVISGILSSFMNFGIEAGQPMANVAVAHGCNPLFQTNVSYVVILWGGLTTNLIWTSILSIKNKSYGDFTNKSTPIANNLIFSALAGTMWFMQFFFYGMGASKLGNGASVLDFAHVNHYPDCEHVGNLPKRMDRSFTQNQRDNYCRYCNHFVSGCFGRYRKFNVRRFNPESSGPD